MSSTIATQDMYKLWYRNSLVFSQIYNKFIIPQIEAVTRGVLWEKGFLKISQNSQESKCARSSFLIKLQASICRPQSAILLRKKLWHRCFLWILRNFNEQLFYRQPPVATSAQTITESTSIYSFKTKIRKWKPDCPRWLCKTYFPNVGFF